MSRPAFTKPHRVLTIWALLCLLVGALLLGYDVALARYGDHLRENDYRTYLGEAWEQVEEEDYVGAMRNAERAKRLAPDNPEPYSFAGSIHSRLRQWDRALDNLVAAIERGDEAPGTRTDAVWAAIESQRYDRAVELGLQYAGHAADDTPLLQLVAEAHLRANRPEEALPYLEACLKETPDNLYQLSRAVSAYRAVGNEERAREMQERIDAIHSAIGQLGSVD